MTSGVQRRCHDQAHPGGSQDQRRNIAHGWRLTSRVRAVTASTFVIETKDGFAPDEIFLEGRDQIVLAVRITPVFGQADLTLVAMVIDEANARGMSLVREQTMRDEYLLLVLEAYDEDADEDE
jgi:hypothetical protein